MKNQKIGVFDSGVGGLSVLREIHALLPSIETVYFADQAHVPYGSRSKEEVRAYSTAISDYLLSQGAQLIVVACNTASAAALHDLREKFPEIPIVGMEPAVKPAAEHTQSGVVGVLATPSTFESELFSSVVARFAQDAKILKSTCSGLVEEIEAGRAEGEKAHRILREALEPMLEQGLDSVVLGCTHYPFAMETIRNIVGEAIEIFDPAPAIARRVEYLLEKQSARNDERRKPKFLTSGNQEIFESQLKRIFPEKSYLAEKKNWDGLQIR